MTKFNEEMTQFKQEILRARDEIKLKLHLASMDARDAWDKLEPKIERFERVFEEKAKQVADEAETNLEQLGKEIEEGIAKIRKSL